MKYLCLIILMQLLVGCSTLKNFDWSKATTAPTEHKVLLTQDTWVKNHNGEMEFKKAGEEITFSGSPLLLESPGYVSVVLAPSQPYPSRYKISLRPIPNWGGKHIDSYINTTFNSVINEVHQIQSLLSSKRTSAALARIRTLREKHPQLSYAIYLEASALLVLGRRAEAEVLLHELSQKYPDDKQTQKLYRQLAGKKESP